MPSQKKQSIIKNQHKLNKKKFSEEKNHDIEDHPIFLVQPVYYISIKILRKKSVSRIFARSFK